jgi:hypothetical protein
MSAGPVEFDDVADQVSIRAEPVRPEQLDLGFGRIGGPRICRSASSMSWLMWRRGRPASIRPSSVAGQSEPV